ncbi:MAG: response regulator, partial [Myxococcota bacterium]
RFKAVCEVVRSAGPEQMGGVGVRFIGLNKENEALLEQMVAGDPVALQKTIGRILVVDDEPQIVRFLRHILAKDAYDVVSTTSSTEALKLLEETTFDMLISDLGIPGVDGIALIRSVTQRYKIPAIAVTGQMDLAAEAKDAGAVQVFAKPFGSQEILDATVALLKPDLGPSL